MNDRRSHAIALLLSIAAPLSPLRSIEEQAQYRCAQCERKKERQEKIINAAVTSAVAMINAIVDIKINGTDDADKQKEKITSHATAFAATIGGIILASIRSELPAHTLEQCTEHSTPDDSQSILETITYRIQALAKTVDGE